MQQDVGVDDHIGRRHQLSRGCRSRRLEVDPGLCARRDRLDIAVCDPDELDAALERHAGALVLHEPAALHPDSPHFLVRCADQPYRVPGGLEDADTLNDDVLTAEVHEDAVRLHPDRRQREVGAVHGQVAQCQALGNYALGGCAYRRA